MNKLLKDTTFECVKLSNNNFFKNTFMILITIGITYEGVS